MTSATYSLPLDRTIELRVPGVDAVSLRLGAPAGRTDFEVAISESPFSIAARVHVVLRIDPTVLRPLKPNTNEIDTSVEALEITLGEVDLLFDADGDLGISGNASVTLPRCMIATTGVIVQIKSLRWLAPSSSNKPPSTPANFTGLYVDNISAEIAGLPVAVGALSMDDVFIGTGGFSGRIAWDDPTLTWVTDHFTGASVGELSGFKAGLAHIGIELRQNAFVECEITGDVFVPYLDKRIGVSIALDGAGGFTLAAGLPVSLPNESGVTTGRPGYLLHVDVGDFLAFDIDALRFSLPAGHPPLIEISGGVELTIGGLDAPPFDFKGLRIDGDGNVAIDGGWIDLSNAKLAPFHGFPIEITKLGFGAEESGRRWIGLNGGLKLADGLPVGASVEGLRISWDPDAGSADDILRSVGVSLEGVGLQLRIDGTLEFDGAVAFFNDTTTGNRGFRGHIHLNLISVKLVVDARLVVGRTLTGDTFFYIYLGVDLPTGIPCFSTGLSFYGFAGLMAVNMRPNRSADEDWYYGWYLRSPVGATDEHKWAVQRDAFAGGIGTTLGTASDDGFAFSCKVLLVLLMPGPQFLLNGKGSFIKQRPDSSDPAAEGAFEFLVVLDIPAKLFQGNLAVVYRVPDLLEIGGGSEVKASWAPTPPADVWHLYVGEKTPLSRRIQARFLSFLRANSYFQLRRTGIELGVWIGVSEDYRYGPARAWVTAGIQGEGDVNWNPANFSATLRMTGDAGIAAFGIKVHVVLNSGVTAKGPEPWYLSMYVYLAIEIDLWFFEWSFDVTLPLTWGDEDSPLPLPAEPVVKSIAAEHLKADESFALDAGGTLTIPADARPVVIFQRPVRDRASIGNPNTANLPADIVGPRTFSYQLLHIALVRKAPGNRVIAASGLVDVSGSSARLVGSPPAQPALPGVNGAILQLPDVGQTLSVTGYSNGILSLSGSAQGGVHPYRLYAPPERADVQIQTVWPGAYSTASLDLVSSSGTANRFAGGTVRRDDASWRIIGNDQTSVIIEVPDQLPTPGPAQLVGLMSPTLEGQWLPVDDRTDADSAAPTTKLMLWARSPFAWFRHNDEETLNGFDRNNPDWACGPKPEPTPICYKFADLEPGPLEGTFVTKDTDGISDLNGTAPQGVEVRGLGPDVDAHWLSLDPSKHGQLEFTFDPPIERAIVRYLIAGKSSKSDLAITAYLGDIVVATALFDAAASELSLSGEFGRVEIVGTSVHITELCTFPGWSCVRFDEQSFPHDATARVIYSQLFLETAGKMTVEQDVLVVTPSSSTGDERRRAREIIVGGYAPRAFDPSVPHQPGSPDPVPEVADRFMGGWSNRATPPYMGMPGVTRPFDAFIPGIGRGIIGPVGAARARFAGLGDAPRHPQHPRLPRPEPHPSPIPNPQDPWLWLTQLERPIVVTLGGGRVFIASLGVILPAPTVRARIKLGGPGLVVAFAGDVEVARASLGEAGIVELRPVDNYLDRLVLTNVVVLKVVEICFDRTPTGLAWADRAAWQTSLRRSLEWMYREDALLSPGLYGLEVNTSIVAGGASPFERWYSNSVDFSVGQPPGITLPSGNAETDKRYPTGGPLNALATYVDFTIPAPGERAFYRAYDVGIAFNEPYVSRMFLAAGKPLSVAVLDSNDRELRRDSRNEWGNPPALQLSAEERYAATMWRSDQEHCVAIDVSQLSDPEAISAGAGELLAPAELHSVELRAQGVATHPVHRFEFVTSRFGDFVHHLSTSDRSCRTVQVSGGAPTNLAALIAAIDAAHGVLTTALSSFGAAQQVALNGSPTLDQLGAFDSAREALRAARRNFSTTRAAAFETAWTSYHGAPPAALLPSNVELLRLVSNQAGHAAAVLRIDSPEPIRWNRTELLELGRSNTVPLRRVLVSFHQDDFGAPDIGTFTFRGMHWTTDAELRIRESALEARVPGAWKLEVGTMRAVRVAVSVTVDDDTSNVTLHAEGSGVSPSVPQNRTEADAPVEMVVTGSDIQKFVLQSSGRVRIHSITIIEWHRPVPTRGRLRFTSATLPSNTAPDDHYVEIISYEITNLEGWSVQWFDALSPGDSKPYHLVSSPITLKDGERARIHGGSLQSEEIAGVQNLMGGAVGPLPSSGIVYQLLSPLGEIVHEIVAMPSASFVGINQAVVLIKEDETRALIVPRTGSIDPGHWRMTLQFFRDAGPELPVLSVGGDTEPQMMELGFTTL